MRHLALFIGAAAAFAPPHAVVARQACVVHNGDECTHEGVDAYAAVQFESTKPSLRTFLKLWLMGGPVRGWRGVGELKAVQDDSGATAEIFVEPETNRVGLIASDGGGMELGKTVQLCVLAHALYDELKDIAGGPEVAEVEPANRLCYPPSAVDAAREQLPLPQRPE